VAVTQDGVVALDLPANLVASLRTNPSPERLEWLAEVPETLRELTQRWSLRVGAPYQPGGECAWVAPARDPAGRDLVLKLGWRQDESAHEADALGVWAGSGAVLVYEAEVWGRTSALLLERCDPGTALGLAAPEVEQDVIVAGLLRRLWSAPLGGHPFRPLQAMCDAWADEFERRFSGSSGVLDPGLARAGMELFRGLPATAEREVLLCTDLHAENILAARREPWLVVDPKPYVGDPAYDALQHMLNCDQRLAADPAGLARRMADLLGLDAGRVTQWLFARCVQESVGQRWLRPVAAALAPT
jgi:streptomycin 6-kinase